MGVVKKVVKSVVGGLFGGGGSSNPVSIPQPTVTAQQLVPQTESVVPESPDLGSKTKRKKVSRKSLMIDRTPSTGGNGSPLNM